MSKRPTVVAFAVVSVLLLVIAPGAQALNTTMQSTETVVGSQHTTTSDFQDAPTTANLTATNDHLELSDGTTKSPSTADTALSNSNPSGAGTRSETGLAGVLINPNTEISELTVEVDENVAGASTLAVRDTSGNTIASRSISGPGTYTIQVSLTANTDYRLGLHNSGAGWTNAYADQLYPITSTNGDITTGFAGGNQDPGNVYAIESVTFSETTSTTPTTAHYVSSTHGVSGAEEAAVNISSIANANANITAEYYDGSQWVAANSTTGITTPGNYTLALPAVSHDQWRVNVDVTVNITDTNPSFILSDDSILFTPHAPSGSNFSPDSGSMLDTRDTTFSVDVSDADFPTAQGDSVDARLFVDGQQVASDTVTSNGTVSLTHQMSEGGEHTYYWELADSYGETTTTSERTINVPGELAIYNVSSPDQLIDNAGEIELTFYTYDESNEVFTRSVTDGTVNLTDLPIDQEITVTANVDGYYRRQTIIRSLYEQQAIYLLNDNKTSYETQFQLNDNTGGSFSKNEPRIIVERALNKSGNTQWVNVAGGRFGVNDYRTTLEANERYRLTVRNSLGDERVFYPYDAEAAQVVPLDVGSVSASADGEESYTTGATYSNKTGTPVVNFEYIDEVNATTSISVNVYERGNKSNVLVNDTWAGTYGTLDLTWTIPEDSRGSSWVIEYSAERSDNTINGRSIVGPRQTILEDIPVWLKTIISIGTIFIVAGLFSRANGAIGGLVTAGVGGMWWFVGFLPPEVGVGVVVLSFLTAGMIFVRGGGGVYA